MDLYCKLYIDTELNRDQLLDFVAKSIGGDVEDRTATSVAMVVDVRLNSDVRGSSQLSEFLFWPYLLEVEPSEPDQDSEAYISALARLVGDLRRVVKGVVPSCDFEWRLEGG